jgi:hypothetical protein
MSRRTVVGVIVTTALLTLAGCSSGTTSGSDMSEASTTTSTAADAAAPTTTPTTVHVSPPSTGPPKITRDQIPEYMHAIWADQCPGQPGQSWPASVTESDCTCLFNQLQDHVTLTQFMHATYDPTVVDHALRACGLS